MKTNKGGISKYCEKHNTKIVCLADLSGISFPQLYLIDKDPLYPVKIETVEKLYKTTRRKFKMGLEPKMYLDFEILHQK